MTVTVEEKVKRNRSKNKSYTCGRCRKSFGSLKGGDFYVFTQNYAYAVKRDFVCNQCARILGLTVEANMTKCSVCHTKVTRNYVYPNNVCKLCQTGSHVINTTAWETLNFFDEEGGKPRATVINTPTLFYGIELEVEAVNERQPVGYMAEKVANDLQGKAVIKYDGSLRGGFEICSAGMTFEMHIKNESWDKMFRTFERLQGMNVMPQRAGMHIHFSRNAVTEQVPQHIYNFFKNYTPQVQIIAERAGNVYCNYPRAMTNYADYMRSHYSAINSRHAGTYEIRCFQTVIQRENFFKNLEFVKALIDLATNGAFTFRDFVNHVNSNKTALPNLYNFLRHVGFLKARGRKPKIFKYKAANFPIGQRVRR